MTGDQPNNPKGDAKAEGQSWWKFWGTNGGAAGSRNMDANAALKYWVSGGLRMPWIEAWNYLYLFTGLFVYIFLCPLDHAATLECLDSRRRAMPTPVRAAPSRTPGGTPTPRRVRIATAVAVPFLPPRPARDPGPRRRHRRF